MKTTNYKPLKLKYGNGELYRLDWDINVGGIDYYGYHLSSNTDINVDSWFICRRGIPEDLIIENLIPANRNDMFVRWGIEIQDVSYISYHSDETELRKNFKLIITRNSTPFYANTYYSRELAYAEGIKLIYQLESSPIEIGTIDWDEKLVGRKIYYSGEPAVIEYLFDNCVMHIIPDKERGCEKFSCPISFKEESEDNQINGWYEYENGLSVDILSNDIWWFYNKEGER